MKVPGSVMSAVSATALVLGVVGTPVYAANAVGSAAGEQLIAAGETTATVPGAPQHVGAGRHPDMSAQGDVNAAGLKVSGVRVSDQGRQFSARVAWDRGLLDEPGNGDRFSVRVIAIGGTSTSSARLLAELTARTVPNGGGPIRLRLSRQEAQALKAASAVVLSVSQLYRAAGAKWFSKAYVRTVYVSGRARDATWRTVSRAADPRCLGLIGPGANLSGCDLTGANLKSAALTGANLTRANLTRADLSSAMLKGATLDRADLSRSNMHGAHAYEASVIQADLTSARLTSLNGRNVNLTDSTLMRADLQKAHLFGANLSRTDMTGASVIGVWLRGGNLTAANLTGADLTEAQLLNAELIRTNLTRADLTRADLSFATMRAVNSTETTWTDAVCPNGARGPYPCSS